MLQASKLKYLGLGAIVALSVALTPAFAEEAEDEMTNAAVEQSVQAETGKQIDDKRADLIDDAVDALKKTEDAVKALDEGDTKTALEQLAIATGKLDILVAREPTLALAPIDVNLIVRDFMADADTIKDVRNSIEALIDDGKFQEARPLMRSFASEVIVETANLPLATYPAAIKLASVQIDEGNIDAAKQTLATAFTTIVITEDSIALPVLRAELLVGEAKMALTNLDEAKTTEASDVGTDAIMPKEYVSAARKQLQIAEWLGYGDEDAFAPLHDELNKLDKKIDDKLDTGGIFSGISKSFDSLKTRLFGDSSG